MTFITNCIIVIMMVTSVCETAKNDCKPIMKNEENFHDCIKYVASAEDLMEAFTSISEENMGDIWICTYIQEGVIDENAESFDKQKFLESIYNSQNTDEVKAGIADITEGCCEDRNTETDAREIAECILINMSEYC